MKYRPPRNLYRWYTHPAVLAGVVLVAIIVFHLVGWLTAAEGWVMRATQPIAGLAVRVGSMVGLPWSNCGDVGAIQLENNHISESFRQLAVENQLLKEQLRELQLVQKQTDYLSRRNQSFVTARVVGKDLRRETQVIVIDQGSRAGIHVGSPVIVNDGVFIGRVTEVGIEHAKVMLLTDARSAVPAAFDRNPDIGGVVSGEFGVSLMFDLIPKDKAIGAGDIVVTSELDPSVPRGMLIGTVTRVESGQSNFFQTAYLQPFVQYPALTLVAVLLTTDSPAAIPTGQ